MSFSFGFHDDDIDIDIDQDQDESVQDANSNTNTNDKINPLDQPLQGVAPTLLSLKDVLNSLKDTPVTFAKTVTESGAAVYRRELFDVKHQLMVEDDADDDGSVSDSNSKASGITKQELEFLMGQDDLQKNVYEGGLKTWECSIDLINKLHYEAANSSTNTIGQVVNRAAQLIELGSGTSLPSCFLFSEYLKQQKQQQRKQSQKKKFVLSDYNKSVLRLVTVPNLIVNWFMTLPDSQKQQLKATFHINADLSSEIQISETLISSILEDLQRYNIEIDLIAGSWGRDFLQLIDSQQNDGDSDKVSPLVILSSETIYSPEVSPVLAETVIALIKGNLRNNNNINSGDKQRLGAQNNLALIAAKDIYFGVGGTVVEFLNYLDKKIGNGTNASNDAGIQYEVEKINASGLNRSIIKIGNV